jgi:hypothetical protein
MIMQPIPLEMARKGLAHQLDLAAPVKFALTAADGHGCAIAEIARVADLHDCEKLAGQALDVVDSWIERGCPVNGQAREASESSVIARSTADTVDSEIARSLDETGWSWEAIGETSYRVHVTTGSDSIGRVQIDRTGSKALRVSSVSTVRAEDVVAKEALAHFALEANRRLRIARLTVSGADDEAMQLVWDAVAPAELPASSALPRLLEAVAFSRSETNLALVALADERIATSYLDHRFPVRHKSRSKRRAASTPAGAVPAEAGSVIGRDNP